MPSKVRAEEADLAVLIRSLDRMSVGELKSLWRSRWAYPPSIRSPDLLRHLIAWRLQAHHFGGLDEATLDLLASRRRLQPSRPDPGTLLRREYQGVVHEVEVLAVGFRYRGGTYRDLTAVAEAITGTHWSGPKFFGLRPQREPP